MEECSMMLLAGPGSAFGGDRGWGWGWGIGEEGNAMTATPVSGRAPCGEIAEMTNQGPW